MKTKSTFSVFALSAILLAMASCGQKTAKKASGNDTATEVAATADSAGIVMDLSSGYAMSGIHKDPMQTVWLQFDSPGNESLYGKITVDGDIGNVRFNQVVMPDGSMDGPFGRDMTYELDGRGAYRLAIGESLMQGDPFEGDCTVELFTGLAVPYKDISNYFVRNDVEDSEPLYEKITSKQDFEKLFGAAATMQARPEKIDFSKQYLVAIIGLPTDTAAELEVVAVLLKDGITTVVYRQAEGEKRSFTIRPFILLAIDKQYDGALRVIASAY